MVHSADQCKDPQIKNTTSKKIPLFQQKWELLLLYQACPEMSQSTTIPGNTQTSVFCSLPLLSPDFAQYPLLKFQICLFWKLIVSTAYQNLPQIYMKRSELKTRRGLHFFKVLYKQYLPFHTTSLEKCCKLSLAKQWKTEHYDTLIRILIRQEISEMARVINKYIFTGERNLNTLVLSSTKKRNSEHKVEEITH